MQILKWVENYLKKFPPGPPKGGYRYKPEGGCALDLLDLYGTEGTLSTWERTTGPSKHNNYPIPVPPKNRQSEAEIQATLAFVRRNDPRWVKYYKHHPYPESDIG